MASSSSSSPLPDAAYNGNLKEVARLLDSGVDVNQKNDIGRTGLLLASCYGDLEIVTLLLDKGASIDIQEPDGWTALMTACNRGRPNIVAFLLERGANPCMKNKYGETALDWAKQRKSPECIAILESYERYHRYRKIWLSFSTSLNSSQEEQLQKGNIKQLQNPSPSLMKVMESSDLVRFVTEFM